MNFGCPCKTVLIQMCPCALSESISGLAPPPVLATELCPGFIERLRMDLSGANLLIADLSGADLRGANLSEANLADAHLGGADLSGANLLAADVTGADLAGAKLDGVIGYKP